jgi:hypothetical protein
MLDEQADPTWPKKVDRHWVGPPSFHRRCVKEYDYVLDLLNRLL